MGGYKKANTDSNSNAEGSTKALDARRQERLYKGLENQYEQAFQTSRLNRGKGLGFSE